MAERFIEFVLIKNYTSFRSICSDVHIIIHGNPVTVFTRIMNIIFKNFFPIHFNILQDSHAKLFENKTQFIYNSEFFCYAKVSHSINKTILNENIVILTQFVQEIIKYINLNKQSSNLVNKQFVRSLISTTSSKVYL